MSRHLQVSGVVLGNRNRPLAEVDWLHISAIFPVQFRATQPKRVSMRPHLFALLAAFLSPSICWGAESTCSHSKEIPGRGEAQLVHTADDAKRLGYLYQEFLDRPEDTIAPKRKSTLKTKISVEKVGDGWNVTIQALAVLQPLIWKNWMEMTICAADGKLGAVRIHM